MFGNQKSMRQDEFRNRYVIKLVSSVAIALLNIIIQVILPHALSKEQFGYYSYNLNVFTSIVVMANLSASNALVAKFSKKNDELGIVRFYLKFYFFEVILLSVGVGVLFPLEVVRESFAGQTLLIVMLGLESAAANKLLGDVIGIYDSMAVSRVPAMLQIVLKVIMSGFVLGTYLLGVLDLKVFYIGQITVTAVIALVLLVMILRYQKQQYPQLVDRGMRTYAHEYMAFCGPLVLSNVVSQLLVIFMNWALMRWSGATESAVFGIAWQINTLVGYVFSPYAELSKREFAVLYNDEPGLRLLYVRSLKMMIWLTSYFAIYIGVCADWILPAIFGNKYADASLVTLMIMVYTVYQAWGQICGAFMLAMEKTKLNAILGIVGQIMTVVLVFVFQIPNALWPNGLGATGIALVYVIGNFISVCVCVLCISHTIHLPKIKTLSIQLVPILFCGTVALLLHFTANRLCPTNGYFIYWVKIMIAGMVYTGAVGGLVVKYPELLGVSRDILTDTLKKVLRRR